MQKQYNKGRSCLNNSLRILNIDSELQSRNLLHIVAIYNYLGDIEKYQNNVDQAIKYYRKAILLCEHDNSVKSLDIIYKNYGQMLFAKREYLQAKEYFEKSIKISDSLASFWERVITESYMAMLYAIESNKPLALDHISRAEAFRTENTTDYEIEILDKSKNLVKNIV